MELGINVVLLVAGGLVWSAVMPREIQADFPRANAERLGSLEQRLGEHSANIPLLEELTRSYLDAGQPGASVAVLRAADPDVLESPSLGSALAQSYEAMGRYEDALASAQLTFDRCARALGASDGPSGTAVPRFRCSAREYARLSIHQGALRRIVAWQITSSGDPRIAHAYDMAQHRARVAGR